MAFEAELCEGGAGLSDARRCSTAGTRVAVVGEEEALWKTVETAHPVDHGVLQFGHRRIPFLRLLPFPSLFNPGEADDAEEGDEAFSHPIGQTRPHGHVAVIARVMAVIQLPLLRQSESAGDDGVAEVGEDLLQGLGLFGDVRGQRFVPDVARSQVRCQEKSAHMLAVVLDEGHEGLHLSPEELSARRRRRLLPTPSLSTQPRRGSCS